MFNTAASIIIVFVIQCDFCENAETRPNLCPRNTTLVGNHCLFSLKSYANFTQNLELCRTKNASLLSISSVQNFKDVCNYVNENIPESFAFLGADQDPSNTTQYIWHHNKRRVNFSRDYWEDEVPSGHLKCIEIISFGNYCRINDIVCWKPSIPVCEIQNQNPCLVNNGGCSETCVPREFGTRMCKCVYGKKVNETKCVYESAELSRFYCPEHYDYIKNFTRRGDCLRVKNKEPYPIDGDDDTCGTRAGLLTLSPETIIKVCYYISRINKYKAGMFWLGIGSSSSTTHLTWTYDNLKHNLSDYRNVIEVQDSKLNDPAYYFVLKLCMARKCILGQARGHLHHWTFCQTSTYNHTCLENNGGCLEKKCVPTSKTTFECKCDDDIYEDINGTCVDINECETNNGGCHHFCHNTVGGFKCSCRDGYLLDKIYHTECEVLCNHQNESEKYAVVDTFKCGCLPGYELAKDYMHCMRSKYLSGTPGADDVDNDDTIIGKDWISWSPIFWTSVAIIFCCSVVYLIIRRKIRRRRMRRDANKRVTVRDANKRATFVIKPLNVVIPGSMERQAPDDTESDGAKVQNRLNADADTDSNVTATNTSTRV